MLDIVEDGIKDVAKSGVQSAKFLAYLAGLGLLTVVVKFSAVKVVEVAQVGLDFLKNILAL